MINNKKQKITKKAQVWTLDYIVGLMMFIVILLIALSMLRDYLRPSNDGYSTMARESDHIASMLVSEGFPDDWTETSVIIPGIAKNNRVNVSQVLEFDKLTYSKQKVLFQNTGDFIYYFDNGTTIISIDNKCFRGYLILDCTLEIPLDAKNVAKTDRLVILNSQIVKLVVLTWN